VRDVDAHILLHQESVEPVSLRLRFWGTRGSIPTPGPDTIRYGGNTACVEVRTADDGLIVLDAGTGIRALGRSLVRSSGDAPLRGDVFLTHAHWDHIQGLPFFAPLFREGDQITIWRGRSAAPHVDGALRAQMARGVFPVTFDEVRAAMAFEGIGSEETPCDGVAVSAFGVRHSGGCVGFRLRDTTGRSLVYVSDNELGSAGVYEVPGDWRTRFVSWIDGADALVHDASYTTDEYVQYGGWGHSTYRDVVDLAIEAGVRRLILFHHMPDRTDEDLDAQLAVCREWVATRGATLEVSAAAEGMTVDV
jgi:phosphoribosyl 1,2-cyclic phosphodiesterase